MKINLWVDDIRQAPMGWHRAKTVTEAIRILDEYEVTEVSLDHDISARVVDFQGLSRVYLSAETFEPVARFIQRMVESIGTGDLWRINLHSANPVGRANMVKILEPIKHLVIIRELPLLPSNPIEEMI
jgi:hypothetical protein